jgi:hypothetical protein
LKSKREKLLKRKLVKQWEKLRQNCLSLPNSMKAIMKTYPKRKKKEKKEAKNERILPEEYDRNQAKP